jgi:hypothetical protein
VGADIGRTQGDWCQAYGIADVLNPDSTSESKLTGFAPALSPLSQYQVGDGGGGNVCQADGTTWGHAVTTTVPGSSCNSHPWPCGVQHYASVYSAQNNSRPWNLWFGDPSLVVSTNIELHRLEGAGWAWGYVCPILRDTTSGKTLEYCLEEWTYDYLEADKAACGTGSGSNDQVVIPVSTSENTYASLYGSSSPTFATAPKWKAPKKWTQIAAQISVPDLENAISLVNSTCAAQSPHLSTDRGAYELLGIEQGVEGQQTAGKKLEPGEQTQSLQLSTVYTFSGAPKNTAAPSVPQPLSGESVTAGSGSWTNSPSTYRYQWNLCNSAGASCSAIPGASTATYTPTNEQAGDTLTVTVVAGNQPDSHGDYAWSAPATSPASPRIVEEQESQASWAVADPISNEQWVYYRGSDSAIWQWYWNGATWSSYRVGGEVAPGTTPVVVRDQATGRQWLYYVGLKDNHIWQYYWNGTSWSPGPELVGGEVTPNSTPTVVRNPITGYPSVYYVGLHESAVWQAYWNGAGWGSAEAGGKVAPSTSIGSAHDPSTGGGLYYIGAGDNAIWQFYWNGASWVSPRVGGEQALGSSPTVTRNPTTGAEAVYGVGKDNAVWQFYWTGTAWASARAGGEVAANTSVAVPHDPSYGGGLYYVGRNDNAIWQFYWNGASWVSPRVGGEVAGGTSPAVTRNPITGRETIYYVGRNDSAIWDFSWNGSEWIPERL